MAERADDNDGMRLCAILVKLTPSSWSILVRRRAHPRLVQLRLGHQGAAGSAGERRAQQRLGEPHALTREGGLALDRSALCMMVPLPDSLFTSCLFRKVSYSAASPFLYDILVSLLKLVRCMLLLYSTRMLQDRWDLVGHPLIKTAAARAGRPIIFYCS